MAPLLDRNGRPIRNGFYIETPYKDRSWEFSLCHVARQRNSFSTEILYSTIFQYPKDPTTLSSKEASNYSPASSEQVEQCRTSVAQEAEELLRIQSRIETLSTRTPVK